MPNGWRTIKSLVHKIRLRGRRGKGKAEFFSREKLRYAPQKEGGWKILCDLPSVWPRLVRPTNLMSRMNGKITHTHTHCLHLTLVITQEVYLCLKKNLNASRFWPFPPHLYYARNSVYIAFSTRGVQLLQKWAPPLRSLASLMQALSFSSLGEPCSFSRPHRALLCALVIMYRCTC